MKYSKIGLFLGISAILGILTLILAISPAKAQNTAQNGEFMPDNIKIPSNSQIKSGINSIKSDIKNVTFNSVKNYFKKALDEVFNYKIPIIDTNIKSLWGILIRWVEREVKYLNSALGNVI